MAEQPRTDTDLASYLKDHPRMMGVLFTASLLLMEASNLVAAGGGSAHNGP